MRDVVLQGDAATIMAGLSDGSVEAIVTDPPYGLQTARWDDVAPPQPFLDQCLRIARGPVLMFGGAAPRSMEQFLARRPRPERAIIWNPAFSLAKTGSNGMYWRWHPIWCWRLPPQQDALDFDIIRINCDGHDWWHHPHTKPLDLMRRLVCLAAPAGATILDPFLGSGTTAVAALREGLHFIGIEIDERYAAIARQRLVDEMAQPRLLTPAAGTPVQGALAFAEAM